MRILTCIFVFVQLNTIALELVLKAPNIGPEQSIKNLVAGSVKLPETDNKCAEVVAIVGSNPPAPIVIVG